MNKPFRISGSLVARLEEYGVRPAAVLRRAGLRADLFAHTRALVSPDELFAFWHAVGEEASDPLLAIKLAHATRTEHFPPIGIAALSTANFGAGIDHIARYKQLTCPGELQQDFRDGEWSLRFCWVLNVEREPWALVEFCFAGVLALARFGTGTRLSPIRVELVRSHGHNALLERHFGCPVHDGAARNAIVFRAEDAHCPFITRNAELLELLAPQLDREMDLAVQHPDSFLQQVQKSVRERLTGHRPTIAETARQLHMSTRSLQRRLKDSGYSYQRVLDDARRQMARYYLSNSVLELNEAAYLLGYEDANSFVRAFRAWEGMPPGHWRATHGPEAVS